MSTESTGLIGKYTLLYTAICIFKCLSYDLLDVDGATMNQNQALDIYHTEEDAGKGGGWGGDRAGEGGRGDDGTSSQFIGWSTKNEPDLNLYKTLISTKVSLYFAISDSFVFNYKIYPIHIWINAEREKKQFQKMQPKIK